MILDVTWSVVAPCKVGPPEVSAYRPVSDDSERECGSARSAGSLSVEVQLFCRKVRVSRRNVAPAWHGRILFVVGTSCVVASLPILPRRREKSRGLDSSGTAPRRAVSQIGNVREPPQPTSYFRCRTGTGRHIPRGEDIETYDDCRADDDRHGGDGFTRSGGTPSDRQSSSTAATRRACAEQRRVLQPHDGTGTTQECGTAANVRALININCR